MADKRIFTPQQPIGYGRPASNEFPSGEDTSDPIYQNALAMQKLSRLTQDAQDAADKGGGKLGSYQNAQAYQQMLQTRAEVDMRERRRRRKYYGEE